MAEIPKTQKAFRYYEDGSMKVEEIPVPVPQNGQVLVKMEYAPLNPSDVYLMQGKYASAGIKIANPFIPGWEGSGTVVQNGGGFLGWTMVGKRVSVTKAQEPDNELSIGGAYQQYMVTSAFQCVKLPDPVSFEQGSMLCVNPLTALSFIRLAEDKKSQAIIITAAASQLGNMVRGLCREKHIQVINIVRKEEQVKMLEEQKCEHILNSSDPDFLEKLGELAKKLRATICFEAVGGPLTGQVMSRMPSQSICYLYGMLSGENMSEIEPMLVIGRNQKLKMFFLASYLSQLSLFSTIGIVNKASDMMQREEYRAKVHKVIGLEEIEASIPEYLANMTQGKYLVCPAKE